MCRHSHWTNWHMVGHATILPGNCMTGHYCKHCMCVYSPHTRQYTHTQFYTCVPLFPVLPTIDSLQYAKTEYEKTWPGDFITQATSMSAWGNHVQEGGVQMVMRPFLVVSIQVLNITTRLGWRTHVKCVHCSFGWGHLLPTPLYQDRHYNFTCVIRMLQII